MAMLHGTSAPSAAPPVNQGLARGFSCPCRALRAFRIGGLACSASNGRGDDAGGSVERPSLPSFPAWPSSDGVLQRPSRPPTPEEQTAAGPRPGPKPRTGSFRSKSGSSWARGPASSQASGTASTSAPTERPSTAPLRPAASRVLGVDFGTKNTGLAIGVNSTCDPYKVISSGDSTADLAKTLLKIAQEKELQGIVVGLPINPMRAGCLTDPDSDSPVARRCRSLANTLALVALPKGIEVYLYDEASTSAEARTMLGVGQDGFATAREKQRHQEDALSAMMLVRRYLNSPGQAVRVRVRSA